jgi:hypothetical protein
VLVVTRFVEANKPFAGRVKNVPKWEPRKSACFECVEVVLQSPLYAA